MVKESPGKDLRESDYQVSFSWESLINPRDSDVWQVTVRNQIIQAMKNVQATEDAPFLVGAGYGQKENWPELDYFEELEALTRPKFNQAIQDWSIRDLEDELVEKLWALSRKIPEKGFLIVFFTSVPH